MLTSPQVMQSPPLLTAVVHFTIPPSEIQRVMGPAIGEVMSTLAAHGIPPAGPVFSHHFRMDPGMFDFKVGVPVASAVALAGRVISSRLPAARTVYQGPYEGLGAAWGEFEAWLEANGLEPSPELWEFYVSGPESGPNPAEWRTELTHPLEQAAV